jgi:hypothetical protein
MKILLLLLLAASRCAFAGTGTNGLDNVQLYGVLSGDISSGTNFPCASWAGTSGGTALAAATTYYFTPNNSSSTLISSDTSCVTRCQVTRTIVLQNFYVKLQGTAGVGHSYTFTVMTNGVASSITCAVSGNVIVIAHDTAHKETILAQTEVGIRVVTDASANTQQISWALEGMKPN